MESGFESLLPSQPDISVFLWNSLSLPFNRATIASALINNICDMEEVYLLMTL